MDQEFRFTESYIQSVLDGFLSVSSQKYVIENLYVFNWESDKLIETRSGLFYEFEIKVSRADFKNDFKNKKDKHAILEGRDGLLPTYLDRRQSNENSKTDELFRINNFDILPRFESWDS